MQERKFGWLPQRPDFRDLKFTIGAEALQPIKSVYLSDKYKLPLPYDQGQLGSCHDPETMVLTDSGWKYFTELSKTDKLASVDPVSSKMIFELPKRLIKLNFKGQLICANRRGLNFKVTPDHKMLVRKWNESTRALENSYELIAAKDLGWYSGLMNRIEWEGNNIETFQLAGIPNAKRKLHRVAKDVPMHIWLKFLGIFLAEGTILKEENKIQLAAVKKREKEFIRQLMTDMDIIALELKDRFTFNNKLIYNTLKDLGLFGKRSYDKFVPAFVFEQSSSNIKYFLEGHFMGDGCDGENRSHYTSSQRLAEDLQQLIFMTGDESGVSVREPRTSTMKDGRIVTGKHKEYRVSVCENKNLSIDKKEDTFYEDYDGPVYCAEMPTYHTLVTKRENAILVAGNCTANGIAFLVHFDLLNKHTKNHDNVWRPSRLFIYYFERLMEGTVDQDAGAIIRDGIKVISTEGVCSEDAWPYDVDQFTVQPNKHAVELATQFRTLQYKSIDNTNKQLLVNALLEGFPIVFGMTVYSSFMSQNAAATGIIPMPKPSEHVEGGHCMVIVGYNEGFDSFIVRNSWGLGWGQKGYCRIPAAYLCDNNYASDFWTVSLIN